MGDEGVSSSDKFSLSLSLSLSDLRRVSQLRSVQKSHTRKSHFVFSQWISACIEEKRCKNERHFEPVT